MPTASLDEFMALNDQVAALIEAGVPLDVDLGRGADAAATLERINALIARRVSQGASLADAVQQDDRLLNPSYRNLVQLGLRSDDLAAGLAGSNLLAVSAVQSRQRTGLALLYPMLVCCLAFVGLIAFCLFFVPVLENTYAGMRIPVGPGLQTLRSLRSTLPYWAGGLPLAALLIAGWQMNSRSRFWPDLPGISRPLFEERAANFAEALAKLLESGTPLPEALRLSADAWSDAPQRDAARLLASTLDHGPVVSESSHLAGRFPPFLRWALLHSEASIGTARALRIAAKNYRHSASRRHKRLRVVIPIVVGLLLGGSAALLYGLALFVPVIDMLRGLASPTF